MKTSFDLSLLLILIIMLVTCFLFAACNDVTDSDNCYQSCYVSTGSGSGYYDEACVANCNSGEESDTDASEEEAKTDDDDDNDDTGTGNVQDPAACPAVGTGEGACAPGKVCEKTSSSSAQCVSGSGRQCETNQDCYDGCQYKEDYPSFCKCYRDNAGGGICYLHSSTDKCNSSDECAGTNICLSINEGYCYKPLY